MKPQRQTSFGGPHDPDPGNCWSTCVAMLLGMDTRDVPNFCGLYPDDDGTWFRRANEWLSERGVLLASFNSDPATWGEAYAHALCIASGPAARGHDHSVVWQHGKVLHDPHPSDAGLIEAREFEVLVIVDPDAFARHAVAIEAAA